MSWRLHHHGRGVAGLADAPLRVERCRKIAPRTKKTISAKIAGR
jgi:hypothetical protein